MIELEFKILDFIQEFLRCQFLDFLMPKITALGNGGIIWIVAAIILLATKKYRRGGVALATGLALVLLIGNVTLKPLIARTRPFDLIEGIELLIGAPRDFSFPSGHTLSSVVAAAILTMTDKRFGYFAIPLAVLVAFSRLYLYVHFPTDILGGIFIGAIISIFIYYIFFKKKSSQ